MEFIKKNLKLIVMASIGTILILIGLVSWNVYFSKYKIFYDQERKFKKAVIRYYEYHKQYLPKVGESRELTLQNLYDSDQIDDLYIPKTRKTCDVNNSFVRVYLNDKNEYIYDVYLKCGKYESSGDHKGPEIILNGDEEITISLNSEYSELGVKEVKDNKDGKIDVNTVTIDNTKVDTKKLGTYKVTYSVRDASYNKTMITRTVIVAKNLTEVVQAETDESNYYRGTNANNYILFSGMLFRIVNVNDDGSIKIVSDDNISNITYGLPEEDFDSSNIKEWLNDYFYPNIYDTSYLKENNKWCFENDGNICTSESEKEYKIGLLSTIDYNKSKDSTGTYLNNRLDYWLLSNELGDSVTIHTFSKDGLLIENKNRPMGTKPVLVLKENLYLASGNGTLDNPYKLGDYSYGKEADLLNTRLVGEYVNYFGMGFRISGFDNNKNIKLTSTTLLENNTTNKLLTASYSGESYVFDPKNSASIAYKLNNEYIDYVDENYIINHEYNRPTFDSNKHYSNFENSTFTAKLSIPASFELFSGANSSIMPQYNYWLIDYINDNSALIINNTNGIPFTIDNDGLYNSNAFKLSIYVSKNVKIKSGRGTVSNPYVIK